MIDIKAAREEYSQLHADNGKLISKVASEKRDWTAEETAQKEKRFARMDQIKAEVKDAERMAAVAFSEGKIEVDEPKGKQEFDGKISASAKREFTKAQLSEGLNQFAKYGSVQDRDLYGTITTSGSSALLPTAVLPPIPVLTAINVYKAILAKYGLSTITMGSTEALKLPIVDDSGNTGATKAEGATSETTPVDPSPSAVDLTTALYEAKPSWFSNTVQNANRFDLIGFVMPQLITRLERAKHSAMDVKVKAVATGVTTCASASAVTYAEVLTWEHSLPIAYRFNRAVVVADSFYKLIRGLADSQSRPIMDNDPQNVFQSTLHGVPIYVSEYMSAVATTAKVGAIVSANGLFIREEESRLTRYVNVPSYPDQLGINIFQDASFGVDSNAVRIIKMG